MNESKISKCSSKIGWHTFYVTLDFLHNVLYPNAKMYDIIINVAETNCGLKLPIGIKICT